MFSISVELLMGRAMMSSWQNREKAEWPPHPDRIFMSLVAAWGERGEDGGERAALEFLESLPVPAMYVPEKCSERASPTCYVPVNDNWKKGLMETPIGGLMLGRSRQPRSFPATLPASSTFYLKWPESDLENHRDALQTLCESVTYLGHSASPVRMWVSDDTSLAPNYFPADQNPTIRLRGFGQGRLSYLKSRFDAQLRPQPTVWWGYANEKPQVTVECHVPYEPTLQVLRVVGGRRLSFESCSMVADLVRRVLMSRRRTDIPEWLSGHQADGLPSRLRRPAILPLGSAGHPHSDGHLLGIGIAIPHDERFTSEDFQLLQSLLIQHGETEDTAAPDLGFLRLRWPDGSETLLESDERPDRARQVSLKPSTWIQSSRTWTSVTPVVLPRFPKKNESFNQSAEDIVAQACIDSGYPIPSNIRLQLAPLLPGIPHSRRFPSPAMKPGIPPRLRMHAEIDFPQAIEGPVLIGAARYQGLGFFRPIKASQSAD